MSKLLVRKAEKDNKKSEIGTKEKCVKKSYISIFQCSHSATFLSRHNTFIFLIISGLQKFRFYTHPLFTYHPPFFHYLFSNFADE